MTTRDHLVYLLQEVYSFHRDVLPLLHKLRAGDPDQRVRLVLQTQHDGVRGEMETTERALNLLSASFSMVRSPLGSALEEASERFLNRNNASVVQQDVHALLVPLTAAGIARSKYQAAIEMALAIGEQDVARLLEEMDSREVIGQADLGELSVQLIQEAEGREERRAA